MAQPPVEGSAGEMMIVGLIDHADRIGKSAQSTQQALTEQIQQLAQLQQWAVNAAVDLQKRTDAAIRALEAERTQLHNTHGILQTNTVQAIHDAVRLQSGDIKQQTVQALASPLKDIQQAAGYVRQNVKETKWLLIALVFFGGLVMGVLIGYLPLRSNQNRMQEQLNRIEQQSLTAQQPAAPATVGPDAHAPVRKGKTK